MRSLRCNNIKNVLEWSVPGTGSQPMAQPRSMPYLFPGVHRWHFLWLPTKVKVMLSETRPFFFFFEKVSSFLDKTCVNQVPEADLWVRSSTYWVPTTTKCTIHKALACSGQHDHCRLRPRESQTIIRRLNCKYESRLKKSTQVTALGRQTTAVSTPTIKLGLPETQEPGVEPEQTWPASVSLTVFTVYPLPISTQRFLSLCSGHAKRLHVTKLQSHFSTASLTLHPGHTNGVPPLPSHTHRMSPGSGSHLHRIYEWTQFNPQTQLISMTSQ